MRSRRSLTAAVTVLLAMVAVSITIVVLVIRAVIRRIRRSRALAGRALRTRARFTTGPRGQVMIDPDTRDIVQDEHAMEVYRKPDGKLGVKIVGTTKQVKDECKALKIGRCGS